MTPTVVIACCSTLCTILSAVGLILWRLGSKVGRFEVIAERARLEAEAAAKSANDAMDRSERAGMRWNAELIEQLRDLRTGLEECNSKLDADRVEFRKVRQTTDMVFDHEKRITALEAATVERRHCETSGVHRIDNDGIPERLGPAGHFSTKERK